MTTYEVIKQAREKIATPEQWCRGYYALDRFGFEQSTDSPAACRFCAVGAIGAVTNRLRDSNLAITALNTVAQRLYPEFHPVSAIVQANDRRGYEAVINIYDTYLAENAP